MADAIQSSDDGVKVHASITKGPDLHATSDRRTTRAHLRRIIGLVRPYKKRWLLATAALFFNSFVNLALPQPVRIAIDDALKTKDVGLLGVIALIAGGGFILMGLLTAYRHYLMSWLGNRVVADLRARSFEHLLRFSPGFFHERKTGELVSRLTDDIGALQHSVGSELSIALRAALTVVGGLTILFFTSPYLTAVMLLMVPPISILAVVIGRLIRRRAREMQDLIAQANSGLKESLSGIEPVQTFNAEAAEAARYRCRVFEAFKTSLKLAIYRGGFIAGVEIAAFSAVTMIVWLGGQQVIAEELSAGSMMVFLIYTVMVATSLASLANIWGNLQRAVGASDRIFALLDEEPTIRDADDALPLAKPRGDIAFEHVDFTYPTRSDVQVLTDVDFAASPGDTIALVGRSGAGKSTIAALLHRFFDPQRGAVTIDGHDLRTLKLEDVRRVIGTVSQDPVLFSGTIGENIAYGRPAATEAEIHAAGDDAHVTEFVDRLPMGYDTLVGERGVKLSGGQRQRVAIARAILADPRILILDEATSHLDSENEALVHAALETLMTGRTTLIIAHRLSTVQSATRILVLEGGRVVESGTHAELLKHGPIYRKLTKSQVFDLNE